VILAGGKGTRLAPYTSVLPKPLMPIGDRAILEIVIERLGSFGCRDITLCVGYLSHLIQAVFDQGSRHGVNITYVREEAPLGTAGPLRLVGELEDTFLVLNGDVLTNLDLVALRDHHKESGALLTIAVHQRQTKIDYGVIRLTKDDNSGLTRVSGYEEKPSLEWLVSMGIYVMEKEIVDFIPSDKPFDFPDLVQALLQADEIVGAYPYDGFWLDIGRHDDYEQAISIWESDSSFFSENSGRVE